MNQYNIISFSKNRQNADTTTPSNVKIVLNNSIICNDNEYLSLKLQSFNTIKSFYSIQNNLNNIFYIVLKKIGENDDEYIRQIPVGNYNVKTLLFALREASLGLYNIEYSTLLNKFIFKRENTNVNVVGYDVYLRCSNSGIILGFKNNVDYLITNEGLYSETFANISGYTSLFIKIEGLGIEIFNINMSSDSYNVNKIIDWVDVSNIQPMDNILIDNKGSDKKIIIKDKKLPSFNVVIVNENGVEFPQMSDYVIHFIVEKHKIKDDMLYAVEFIIKRLNDLIQYITFIFSKLKDYV